MLNSDWVQRGKMACPTVSTWPQFAQNLISALLNNSKRFNEFRRFEIVLRKIDSIVCLWSDL